MNSVKGLRQLLVNKGIANAEGVKTFSKLKELTNLAHEIRVPKEEEYQNGPRRAIKKTYCGSNSVSGYETSTGKAGLNGMTNFLKSLPNLKSINKIEHPTELACAGLLIPVSDFPPGRTACECNGVADCSCESHDWCKCKDRWRGKCDDHHHCTCNSRTGVVCGTRTTCACYTVAVVDTVKLCACDSVVTY